VEEFLGEAAFSTAIQCKDLASENEKDPDVRNVSALREYR